MAHPSAPASVRMVSRLPHRHALPVAESSKTSRLSMCPAADGDHDHGGLSAVSVVASTPALLGSLTQSLLTCIKTTTNTAHRQRKYRVTEGQADVTLGINTPPKTDRLGILVNGRLPGCAYDRS